MAVLQTQIARSARAIPPSRSIWLFAFLATVVGYVALLTHFEGEIADVETRIADIQGIVSSDSFFARAKPHLIKRRDALLGSLHTTLTNATDDADAIGSFLQESHTIAGRNGVQVISVTQSAAPGANGPSSRQPISPARPTATVPAPTRARASTLVPHIVSSRVTPAANVRRPFEDTFVPIPFQLTLTGTYGSLLRTVSQLAAGTLLVRIDRVSLSPASSGNASLRADVSAIVFRPISAAPPLTGGPNVRNI